DANAAGVLALTAGLDVELPFAVGYGSVLAESVRKGLVSEQVLDEAVRRVLREQFALGLFDHPYLPEDPIVIDILARDGCELADAVRRLVPGAEITVVAGTGLLDDEPSDIPAAVEAARGADVVILALGGRSGMFQKGITEGEGGDTADIELPTCQVELVKAVAE